MQKTKGRSSMYSWLSFRIQKVLGWLVKPKMLAYKRNFQNSSVENVRISTSTFIDYKQNLFLKSHIYIGHFNFIEASHKIYIEKGCQITSFVSISSHSSHNSIRLYGTNYGAKENQVAYVTGEIHIGEFTFVGPHSVIMPNTKIGKGCIVSAYSFVKGEFPDFSIIAGNPAKVVGDVRNSDNIYLEEHPELTEYYMK